MHDNDLQACLLDLFRQQGVELEPDEEGWLLTDGDFPALGARWHAGSDGEPGRLDVDVVIDETRRIEDSFAGADAREALAAFERSTLPLLLAACWYVTDDRRMRIAAWDIGVRTWDVFVGPLDVRGTGSSDWPMPAEAAVALQAAASQLSLTPALHWIHLLHRTDAQGRRADEALLDGDPWPAGTQRLQDMAWPVLPASCSARQLILLDVRDY